MILDDTRWRLRHATETRYHCGMLNRDYEGQNCSIARALEVVGERWTLLIIRDVLLGLHRFDEFQESLGIARNVLTDRLNRLVDEGVLERVLYSERPERYEYQLTKKGLDLNIALTALRQWGDDYLSEKPPRLQLRKVDKKPVVAAIVPKGTKSLRTDEIEALAALSHLQRPLALLAPDVDADLRDLCLRRTRVLVTRRWCLRRCRPPAGPARSPRRADGVERAVHGRRIGRLAVRRPRLAGSRDRRSLERGQRRSARSAPEPRPRRRRPHDRDRSCWRHRSRRARLVSARRAGNLAPRPALRSAVRPLRGRLCRRLLDAGADREAWPLPPHGRAPTRPGCRAPSVLAGRSGGALLMVNRWPLLLARPAAGRSSLQLEQRDRLRQRHRGTRRC